MQNNNIDVEIPPQAQSLCNYNNEAATLAAEQHVASKKKLLIAIAISNVFMVCQLVAGFEANSLAIQTDALHMLADILCFVISWLSLQASIWEATSGYTFGFGRIGILGSLVSVLITWSITGSLCYEAVQKLIHRSSTGDHDRTTGWVMVLISGLSVCVNVALALVFSHGHDHEHTNNVNIQSAYIHAIGDFILSLGVVIAGIIIWVKPKWQIVDLICTFVSSVLVLWTTLPMIRKIHRVLMECTPKGIDSAAVAQELVREIDEVGSVHQVHIWAITQGNVMFSCHVKVSPDTNPHTVLDRVIQHVKQRYIINQVTVQVELSEDVVNAHQD
ncbi:hypothetical protein MKW94_001698 [Papaver nudicaule]|uniref:Uncharacterized protein n=1 Tax=Papaver nudicaule TaxID=74823 RepID=A0AA41SIY6_PAPNU|nr:hypothetical protein [Papaver nudicaule]